MALESSSHPPWLATPTTALLMMRGVVFLTCIFACAALARGEERAPFAAEAMRFFEAEVRPLLVSRCGKCHGADRQRGGLRLDSRESVLAGGDSGPAIDLEDPSESLLIEAIEYASYEMPPTGKLPQREIDVLIRWVKLGAPWPGDETPTPGEATSREKITKADREWWSFRPVEEVAAPAVDGDDWSRNPIDRFVFQKLREQGLSPAHEAERRALIRRVTFDLIGLPPTADEVEAFEQDDAPDAYERLVDRLLASPHYGERWARHWLDLVRYAESDGWRQDAYRPEAWRYRDYVVQAFNEDKPYDQFVSEQLAGDEIAPHDPAALCATAFLRHGIYEYNQRDVRTQWKEIVDEITDVTADVFMGLGLSCARCHDHKFDPLLQRDYYRLRAFFAAIVPRDDIPLATPEQIAEHALHQSAWEQATAELQAEIDAIEEPYRQRAARQAIEKFTPDLQAMIRAPAEERTTEEHQLAELAYRQVLYEFERLSFKAEDREQLDELRGQLKQFDELRPAALGAGMTVRDAGPKAAPTIVPTARREEVEPGFPQVLADFEPAVVEPLGALESTGRRAALARWLTQPDHPLTGRVMVNRLWQQHFGAGLVRTTSDFGRLGEQPSHPEMLDWLAGEFVREKWRLKSLHRLMVTSATYRQAAIGSPNELAQQLDPENRWLWRMPIRRLDAEQIRDAALVASGELNRTQGGRAVAGTTPRRSIYVKVVRNRPDPLLQVFDVADGFSSMPQRNVTTTAMQSLLALNGDWMLDRAAAVAASLHAESGVSDESLVAEVYRRVLSRRASTDELETGSRFLAEQTALVFAERQRALTEVRPFPTGKHEAVLVSDANRSRLLLDAEAALPDGDFTIEAVFVLNSLYDDAAVRTIAAQWSGRENDPGWSLGVTSKRSRYSPRNLILQIVADQADGRQAYAVLPANLHVELDRPYYVAAIVRVGQRDEPGSVMFHVQDLSSDDPARTAAVPHPFVGPLRSQVRFCLGGRDGEKPAGWDGLLAEVRLSHGALDPALLLPGDQGDEQRVVAHWQFSQEGFGTDLSGNELHLHPADGDIEQQSRRQALVDFCHVLLNSNEFLYVE